MIIFKRLVPHIQRCRVDAVRSETPGGIIGYVWSRRQRYLWYEIRTIYFFLTSTWKEIHPLLSFFRSLPLPE